MAPATAKATQPRIAQAAPGSAIQAIKVKDAVLLLGWVDQAGQAGAAVRVVAQGAGFVVSSEAQALSAGVVGQVARVRMESGRVTSGVVLDTRTVKIDI